MKRQLLHTQDIWPIVTREFTHERGEGFQVERKDSRRKGTWSRPLHPIPFDRKLAFRPVNHSCEIEIEATEPDRIPYNLNSVGHYILHGGHRDSVSNIMAVQGKAAQLDSALCNPAEVLAR